MTQLSIKTEGPGFDVMANLANGIPKRLPKEVARVANNTAKAHRKEISRSIREEINIKNAAVLRRVVQTKRARVGSPDAHITIKKGRRPGLKEFGARQTKAGVSYKIKKSGGRRTVKSAFIVKSKSGHVFRRKTKKRLPIVNLMGVSVTAVFNKNKLIERSKKQIFGRMQHEASRRVRAITVTLIRRKGREEGLSSDQINQRIKSRLG